MLSPSRAAICAEKIAPASRTGLDEPHRKAPRRLDRGDAAAGGDEIDGAAELLDLQGIRHAGEVAVDQGLHIGVGDRGGRALIFADLRTYRGRHRHGDAGHFLTEDRGGAALMLGIGVRVQEGDRHALDLQLTQFWRECTDSSFVQREADGAVRIDALGHGKAQAARCQRLRLVDAEIVLVIAALGADIEHVAKAVGRDQRCPGAAALDDRVGRQRRAVNEDVDVADMCTCVRENETHSIQHRLLWPLRRRQHLAGFAYLAHVQHDVGERATNINGKPHFGSLKHSKFSG